MREHCGQHTREQGTESPPRAWLHSLVHHCEQTATKGVPTGKHSTNYHADTEALLQAASMIQDSNDSCKQAFLLDALSVLEAYQNNKLPSLTKALQKIAKKFFF